MHARVQNADADALVARHVSWVSAALGGAAKISGGRESGAEFSVEHGDARGAESGRFPGNTEIEPIDME